LLIEDAIQLFLARALEDQNMVVQSTKESLLRLLNHPNLVSLIDVIHDTDIAGGSIDYTVWEYCDKGNLSQLLESSDGMKRVFVLRVCSWMTPTVTDWVRVEKFPKAFAGMFWKAFRKLFYGSTSATSTHSRLIGI